MAKAAAQPDLPMKCGHATMTHGRSKTAPPRCSPLSTCWTGKGRRAGHLRHRHHEFIRFLNAVKKTVRPGVRTFSHLECS